MIRGGVRSEEERGEGESGECVRGRGGNIYRCITAWPIRPLVVGVKVPGVRGEVGTLVDWIPGERDGYV